MTRPHELTVLLQRYRDGDGDAAEELAPLVLEHLRGLAHHALRGRGGTLQTTALLNEAWLKLGPGEAQYEGREHFLAVAARAIRSIVIDHARRRNALRRGGDLERIELDAAVDVLSGGVPDLLELDVALEELAEARPELARVVELRFFAGMKHPEIAKVMQVPLRKVERWWATARGWLYARLSDEESREAEG